MFVDVVKIGNSKGIRIPAYILKECMINDQVQIDIVDGKIIITPVQSPRKDWAQKFKDMHKNGDDELLIDEIVDVDTEDLEWK
jgi:antitoxin MazE